MLRRLVGIWQLASTVLLGCSSQPASVVSDPVSTACGAQASAYCERLQTCTPVFYSLFYSSADDCDAKVAQRCRTFAAMPGMEVDDTRLSSCSTDVSAMSCDDFTKASERGEIAGFACVLKGTRGVGEGCFVDEQCATGLCDITAGTCGTCQVPLPLGATCTSGDGKCGPSEVAYCDVNGTGKCRAYGDVGAPCELWVDPFCRPGLSCSAATPHVCEVPPIKANAPCGGLGMDQCAFMAGLSCTGSCEPVQPVSLGQTCGGLVRVCVAGTYCAADETCQPAAVAGEPCSQGGLYPCQFPALCVNGTCVEPAASSCQ